MPNVRSGFARHMGRLRASGLGFCTAPCPIAPPPGLELSAVPKLELSLQTLVPIAIIIDPTDIVLDCLAQKTHRGTQTDNDECTALERKAKKWGLQTRLASVSIAGWEVVEPLTPDQTAFWHARGYAAHRDHSGMIVTAPLLDGTGQEVPTATLNKQNNASASSRIQIETSFSHIPTATLNKQNNAASSSHIQVDDSRARIPHLPTATLNTQNNANASSFIQIETSSAHVSHIPTAKGGKSKKGNKGKSKGKGGGIKGYWAGDARYDIEDRRRAEAFVHQWQFGLGKFGTNARRAAVLASWPEGPRTFLHNMLTEMLKDPVDPSDSLDPVRDRVIVSIQSTIERLAEGMDVEEVSKLMEDDMASSSSDEDLNIGQIGMD